METIELLIRTIENVKMLENNIVDAAHVIKNNTEKSKKFRAFYQDFLFTMLQRPMETYPVSFREFLLQMNKPVKDWGYFSEEELKKEGISNQFKIMDTMGVTAQASELLNEYKSYREVETFPVRNALIYCREIQGNGLFADKAQELYTDFRNFVIKNPIANEESIYKFAREKDFDKELTQWLRNCYEDIPNKDYRVCQSCGWTLEIKYNQGSCIKESCKEKYDVYAENFKKVKSYHNLRVKPFIQLTTVIPGLQEMHLYKVLKKVGATVELYPDIERRGDVYISKLINGQIKELWVDVKDYTNPNALIKALELDLKAGLIKTQYIAVPNTKGTKAYLQYVNDRLRHIPNMKCKVYSFSQIVKMFNQVPSTKKMTMEEILID